MILCIRHLSMIWYSRQSRLTNVLIFLIVDYSELDICDSSISEVDYNN